MSRRIAALMGSVVGSDRMRRYQHGSNISVIYYMKQIHGDSIRFGKMG